MSLIHKEKWQRPYLYGTIVAIYLFVMSALAVVALAWSITVAPSNTAAALFLILLAPSIPAAMMLMKKEPREMTKGIAQLALAFWTLLSIFIMLAMVAATMEPPFTRVPAWSFLFVLPMLLITGVMWIFLQKRFPRESGRLFNLSR